MPDKTSASYAHYSQQLESLADGIAAHAAESGFPKDLLVEETYRAHRTELENLRQHYEKLETETRTAYDRYEEKAKKVKDVLTSAQSTLYGAYGKKNPVLADFGFAPIKTGGKTGTRKK